MQNLHNHSHANQGSDGTQPDEAVAMVVLAKECKVDCDR